jgi:hypothetical protein
MTTKTADRDATLTAAYFGVAGSGALLMIGAGVVFGLGWTAGVALGVVLALSNLWVLERLVRGYLDSEGGRWTVVAVVKAAAILAVVAILMKLGVVTVAPLAAGYGALPIGIVIAGLWPMPKTREEA